MDAYGFDDLTRTLANASTRRSLVRSLLAGTILFGFAKDDLAAMATKTTICHRTDDGYNIISVANPALAAHFHQGDFTRIDCCTDGDCPGDGTCQAGTCVAPEPEACPPFTTRIDGICQHPCPSWNCQCGDEASLCLASYAGEALCFGYAAHGVGLDCQSDQDCQDAFGGYNDTTGPNDFIYVCQQTRPDHPGGSSKVCFGNYRACSA